MSHRMIIFAGFFAHACAKDVIQGLSKDVPTVILSLSKDLIR